MGYGGFRGGVHPFPGKDITKEKAVLEYLPQGELVYPLSQHIGAPARAAVSVGDEVLAGQIIGEADGSLSANVIGSVSGRSRYWESPESGGTDKGGDPHCGEECRNRRLGRCGLSYPYKTDTGG